MVANPISFKGIPFPMHSGFALEETDFWLTDSDTAAFPESCRGFDFPDFMAGPFPETEQGNNEQ